MKTIVYLDFFIPSNLVEKNEKIINRIAKLLIKTYGKDSLHNEQSTFSLSIESDSWENTVYRVIQISQTLGRQWILTGSIDFEFSAWTNHPTIVGVESINVDCSNQNLI